MLFDSVYFANFYSIPYSSVHKAIWISGGSVISWVISTLVICICFTTHISKNYIHFAVKYIIIDFLTLSNSILVLIGRIGHVNIT